MSNIKTAFKRGNPEDEFELDMDSSELVRPGDEASRISGLARNTLNSYRSRNLGPNWYKVGGRIYYLRNELKAFSVKRPSTKRGRPRKSSKPAKLAKSSKSAKPAKRSKPAKLAKAA